MRYEYETEKWKRHVTCCNRLHHHDRDPNSALNHLDDTFTAAIEKMM